MEEFNFAWIGFGAALALAGIGSAIGIGTAAQAAIGAIKKAHAANKRVPGLVTLFVAAPFSQLLYGFVLMFLMLNPIKSGMDPWKAVAIGVFGGIGMGFSAIFQGKAGACAADALVETGKGGSQFIQMIGIIEGVALLIMVFMFVFGIIL